MVSFLKTKLTFLSWSPWRKGWPRLIVSTFVTLYLLGLVFALVALNVVTPLATGGFTYGTYTISGPLYQGNIFSGATLGDRIKTIRLYPDREGTVQNKAWTCTKVCHDTPGCHTFVIKMDKCYLTSFNACKNPGGRYLLEWEGATTYELRAVNDTDLHQTCLARCLEIRGCDGCGRPRCNGSSCENCPSACWDIAPSTSGIIVIYPNLSLVTRVKCDGHWQRWWKDGTTNSYDTLFERLLKVRVVLYYNTQDLILQADFASFEYENGKISVGKFVQGTAGNGWGAPFHKRAARTPPASNCRQFFYSDGVCEAGGMTPYPDQMAMNVSEIELSYSWRTGDVNLDSSLITTIELWIKPQDSQKDL